MIGNRTDNLPYDKNWRSRSHFLSKIRKQCSDHELPTCTACLREWFKCIQPVINQNSTFNPNNNDDDFTNTNTTNNIGFSYGKKCVINKRAMGNDRSISNTKFTTTFLKSNHLVKSDVLFPT